MKTRVNLRKLISLIQAESGITIFLITHDPEEALLLADRIYILASEAEGIKKEIKITQARDNRKIANPKIYQELENIMEIFTGLVSDLDYAAEDIKNLF
jgi:NitT/TauT family transport system ATP-binding protein